MTISAEVRWPSPNSISNNGLRGTVVITQPGPDKPTLYKVRLSGFQPNSYHGFHIHDKPVTSYEDINKSCKSCGGHFNPTNKQHGSIFNELSRERHAGDLINNIRANGTGSVYVEFLDDMAILIPTSKSPYTILGRSIVIHELADDLGRQGVSKKIPYVDSKHIISRGTPEDRVTFYNDENKRDDSLVTGNAGPRLACGNIIATCKKEVLDYYIGTL